MLRSSPYTRRPLWIAIACIAAVGASAALLFAAGASADRAWDPVLAEMGADRYASHCSSCHGQTGRGDGPVGGALKTRPADLTTIALRRDGQFPDAEIARFIDGRFEVTAHGTREMPVWGEPWSPSQC